MRYVRLGKTDLQVSAIAFGTWSFGGEWGSFDAGEAKKTVGRALDLGITFFDTAQAYGFGASERLLAEALWPRVARDRVVIATKGGPARRARHCSAMRAHAGCVKASSRACAVWGRTTSICTRCTGPTPRRRRKRPAAFSRISCAKGRSATPVSPTTARGRWPTSRR